MNFPYYPLDPGAFGPPLAPASSGKLPGFGPNGFGERSPVEGRVEPFPITLVAPGETVVRSFTTDLPTRLDRFYVERPSEGLIVVGLKAGSRWLVGSSSLDGGISVQRLRDEQGERMGWPTLAVGMSVEIHVRNLLKKRSVPLVAGFWVRREA